MTDIISTLPDAFLCHILSFLETKQSVATSILSKRWNHLCLSVDKLYSLTTITDQDSNYDFNDFVTSVLLARGIIASPIKSFHLDLIYEHNLHLYIHYPVKIFTNWINFVLQRGVECLQLRLETFELPKLPVRILTCRTLVVLKLSGFVMDEGFSYVVLPFVKTLRLEDIWFPTLRDFMLLLIGCPVLEDFFTYDVSFESKIESLTGNEWKSFCLSNLRRVDIDCAHCFFPLEAVQNVPSMRIEINEVLYYDDLIPTFHNLIQLELICHDYSWPFLLDILNHCSKLQKLEFFSDEDTYMRNYDKENGVDPDVVPQCLSLHLRTCCIFDFYGVPGELMLAKYISKNARVLQTMKIWNGGQLDIEEILSSYPWASSMCKLTVYDV